MSSSRPTDPLMKSALARDTFCANSLRVSKLDQLRFNDDPEAHFCVSLIGDTARCLTCQVPQTCRCLRDHFQSTANSKRRVSTFLYWKNKLGLGFPVGDCMLVRSVWSSLESCKCGIKQGNGQRKIPKGSVCINPYHYHATHFVKIMTPLMNYLQMLNMHQDKIIRQIADHLDWNGTNFSSDDEELASRGFNLLTRRVRQMVEDEGFFTIPAAKSEPVLDYDSAYDTGSPGSSTDAASPDPHQVPSDHFQPDSPPEILGGTSKVVKSAPRRSKKRRASSEGISLVPNVVVATTPPASPTHDENIQMVPDVKRRMPSPPEEAAPATANPHGEPWMDELLSEFVTAHQMMPLLQQRQWPDQAAEISEIGAGLRSYLESDIQMFNILGNQAASNLQSQQGAASPWAPYINTNVNMDLLHKQPVQMLDPSAIFSAGIDAMPTAAYNLDALTQLPGFPMTDFNCMVSNESSNFFNSQSENTASMIGTTSGMGSNPFHVNKSKFDETKPLEKVYRGFCQKCQSWSFASTPLTQCTAVDCGAQKGFASQEVSPNEAADVPRLQLAPGLEVGDVVALIERGRATFVVKLNPDNLEDSSSVGVIGKNDNGKLRVNLIGLVEVKVAGPVVPLDMVYGAKSSIAGIASVTRGTQQATPCLLGQAMRVPTEFAHAKPQDINLIKCLVVPPTMRTNKKVIAAMIEKLNLSLSSSMKAAASNFDEILEDVTAQVAELDVLSKYPEKTSTFKKVDSVSDEDVVTLLSHSSGKSLEMCHNGTLSESGDHGLPESHFLVTKLPGGILQLGSVCDDSSWLSIAQDDVKCIDNAESDTTKISLVPKDKSSFVLRAGKVFLGSKDGLLHGVEDDSSAIRFTVYSRIRAA